MSRRIEMSPGVLIKEQVKQLFNKGFITCRNFNMPDIGASAFDLRLGRSAWLLAEGQRPSTRELEKLKDRSTEIIPENDSDGEFFHFKKEEIYLVKLDCSLYLPENINGRATGRSSIGRLDVITRLLTERSTEYDIVESGYAGPLYLLVLPQTFSLKVAPGDSLNQLRLFCGPPHSSIITRSLIGEFGTPFWYVRHQDRIGEYRSWESELLIEYQGSRTADPALFDLTVDLADPEFDYIFKAKVKDPSEFIDLRKDEKSYNPAHCFEKTPIDKDRSGCSVLLERGSFYIMKSKERLYIPKNVAVEVIAISERIGDIRIHYAGFAHPGFGRHENSGKSGTPLIFEVRATDMDTRLYDNSLLARIQLFRMAAETEPTKSAYDHQELKLSSVFADWRD